jgi:hypothetical protein
MDLDATGKINRFLVKPFGTDSLGNSAGLDIRVFDTTNFTIDLTDWGKNDRTLLDSLQMAISFHSDSSLRVSGTMLEHPDISITAASRELSYRASSEVSDMVTFYLRGKGQYYSDKLVLPVDTLALDFGNKFVWQTEQPFKVTIDSGGGIAMDTLSLYRPELGYDPEKLLAQRVKIGFALTGDSIRYAFVHAPLLKLKEIPLFFSQGKPDEQYSSLGGNITNLALDANGSLADPTMHSSLHIKNFNFNDVTFDTCSASLTLEHRTVTGQSTFHVDTAKFSIQSRRSGKEVLALPFNNSFFVSIDSFPVHLKFAGAKETEEQKRAFRERVFAIRAEGKDYPLDMFSPFLPLVSDVHGLFNAKLSLFGTVDSIHLRGNMDIQRSSLIMSTTNVPYYLSGTISLTESEMRFDSITVENLPSDDKDGEALVRGILHFDGLKPENFDFTMESNRLTVMTDNTKEVMPSFYGPLTIQTGERPLRFFGSMDEPHISGDLIIPHANLTLPQNTVGGEGSGSDEIIYRTLDTLEEVRPDTTVKLIQFVAPLSLYDEEDSAPSIKKPQSATPAKNVLLKAQHPTKELSFTEKLLYDTLRVSIPGDVWLNIYFNKAKGLFGDQLTAEVRSEGDLTLKRKFQGTPIQFNGVVAVTERSSYTFLKAFNPVYGTITFLNDISNPILNIKAEYIGQDVSPDAKTGEYREYKVLLTITGTPSEPKLTMEMYQKNLATGRFEKMDEPEDVIKNDVLAFLATGTVMSQTGATNSQEISQSLKNSVGSQAANTIMNSVLGQTALKNYIRSASVEFGETTKLKVTAGYKDITFQYGSQSLSDPLAADYMVEIPASTFMKFKNARNLLTRFEAHNYSLGTGSPNSVIIQPNFAVSVFYRWFLPAHVLFR